MLQILESGRRRSIGWTTKYYAYALRQRAILASANLIPRGKGQRLLILDPSLIGFGGHHIDYCHALYAELRNSHDISVYCNFEAHFGIVAQFRARPVFGGGSYATVGNREFSTVNRLMTESIRYGLQKIEKDDLQRDAVVLVHTATLFQLAALSEWYNEISPARRPKLVLLFHTPLERGVPKSAWPDALAVAASSIASLSASGRLFLAATNSLLAEKISAQVYQPCAVLPHIIRWPDLAAMSQIRVGSTFGIFGGFRLEKGAALLAEAIPQFVKRHPTSHFIIHAPSGESHEPSVRALELVPQVEFIRRNLVQKAEYYQEFCRVNCIMLPYDPAAYACRISGILLEAYGLGRRVIVSPGLSLGAYAGGEDGSTFSMSAYTSNDLLEALERAWRAMSETVHTPKMDSEVVSRHRPSAFCSALMNLLS